MSWGKETLRLRLKPIETNSECTAVCVMIIMTHTAHSECVNGVEIVAEETTPRHLSGGDKPEEGMPDMFVGASYAGATAIAQKSLLTA